LQVKDLWKTSYKLTKRFQHPDLMGPLKAAATIKNKLEKFRINMPLINALCNPGIKERHWQLMSEKVCELFWDWDMFQWPLLMFKMFFLQI